MNADLNSGGVFFVDRTFAAMFCELLALHRLPLRHVPNDPKDART